MGAFLPNEAKDEHDEDELAGGSIHSPGLAFSKEVHDFKQ